MLSQALQLLNDDNVLVKKAALASLQFSLHAISIQVKTQMVWPCLSRLLQSAAFSPEEAADSLELDKALASILEQVNFLAI